VASSPTDLSFTAGCSFVAQGRATEPGRVDRHEGSLDRLLRELFQLLDKLWSIALRALDSPAAAAKMTRVFCISDADISSVEFSGSTANPLSASGTWVIREE